MYTCHSNLHKHITKIKNKKKGGKGGRELLEVKREKDLGKTENSVSDYIALKNMAAKHTRRADNYKENLREQEKGKQGNKE